MFKRKRLFNVLLYVVQSTMHDEMNEKKREQLQQFNERTKTGCDDNIESN